MELPKKKRKVLFLISNLGGGGAEKVLIDLTNHLNFQENEVEVRTLFNEGKYRNDLNENIQYTTILKNPTLLQKRILSRIIKYFPSKWVYRMFVKDTYDVEIAFLESLPVKLLCGSTSDAVKIAWVHADIFAFPENLHLFRGKERLIDAYSRFDKVVCVSDSVKQSFVEHTGLADSAVTIYNPIDKAQILRKAQLPCPKKADPQKFTMVSIGRVNPEKGYGRLCEVIQKLVPDYPNIELWILGEGLEFDKIKQFISQNHLETYIHLLGFQDNPYHYLNQADLFVSASFTEGYSLVLAEAMVLGKPVLSTDTVGPRNILSGGKYGYLAENSAEGLYHGIKDLLDHPAKLEEVREQVCARQGFFKLEEIIRQTESLFALKDTP